MRQLQNSINEALSPKGWTDAKRKADERIGESQLVPSIEGFRLGTANNGNRPLGGEETQ